MRCPRVLIAGTSSGSGKTTAVCAVLSLLKRRGIDVKACKCGPDYLDPTFHEMVTGVQCTDLDPFFSDANQLRWLLSQNAGSDITVVEGVMGYYDGTGESGSDNSTYTVAQGIQAPVILVVPTKGVSTSLLAVIEGFLNYVPESGIAGVLFDRISPSSYQIIKQRMQERFSDRISAVGYVPELPEDCLIPSRHLGLVAASEIEDISGRLDRIANLCKRTIDIDAILSLAGKACELAFDAPAIPRYPKVRIAVAKDRAFFFYYHDLLRLLERMGAEISFFSPLGNERIPEGSHGLLLGGGYPELYPEQLEASRASRESVSDAIRSGMPTIAECGGFQYLGRKLAGHEMCGVLSHESFAAGKLVRFGYVTLTSKKDGLLGKAGTVLRGHEFHYWDSTIIGEDFTAEKPSGKTWDCAVTTETLYAGYPHLYLPSSVQAVEAFYLKCLEYKEKTNDNSQS